MSVCIENGSRIVEKAIADSPTTTPAAAGSAPRLGCRRPGAGPVGDLDLAAAEHYMFAHWMVCLDQVSGIQMRLLVRGYDEKKQLNALLGDADAEQVTDHPISPQD